MLDFLKVSTRMTKTGTLEIYPRFVVKNSDDLMIRGRDFYAIWVEDRGLWSTDEQDAIRLIDAELSKSADEFKSKSDQPLKVLYLWDAETGMIDRWHKYCQKQMWDNFHMLDETLIFSNNKVEKKDYASKRLSYPLEAGDYSAWDTLLSTLYSAEERHKIEWAIGSIISGDSKHLQKFLVLYGAAGTGKSTILNIVQLLFEGYYSVFDAKALGSSSSSFALEAFRTNPLVGIQHDGDLSRIEDNTRLNSLVSHEWMTVNEKYKATYPSQFKCFLFMGTNRPVKITDARSGLLRRLIDVTPSGNKIRPAEYKQLTKQVKFELGAIAYHCREVYLENPDYYDDYIPIAMLGASNDFYNFVIDSYHIFKREDGTTLKAAWALYKQYCDEAKVPYPLPQKSFKEELKNYFHNFTERFNLEDGTRVRSFYSGFRTEKFDTENKETTNTSEINDWLDLSSNVESVLDKEFADFPAQYASDKEIPLSKWDDVNTTLSDLDTSKLHYVKPPEKYITVDFDIKDEQGNKSFVKNKEAALKWPPTYAELSKGGEGIHLEYIYTGDVNLLSRSYEDDVEIKVFTGKSSLRRKLIKCNTLPIATISSGLPLREAKKVVNSSTVKSEKKLRELIKRNLEKEIHPSTKCSVDFIYKILEDAYNSGLHYDVSDMKNSVFAFAANSTHQADYCIGLIRKMKFKSEETSPQEDDGGPLIFYDVEVFPNLFIICWKKEGDGSPVIRMINPKPSDVEELTRFRLIGFNCRRYDNHMLYAAMMGYNTEQLYNLSQRIINAKKGENRDAFFGEAYNISYTDIYDFASAGNKKSLKKLEIEMGIHHQELGLPWDKPVPEKLWNKVADYCVNDVIATEAAFHYLSADWTARQILADLAEMSVNDTTNTLTTKIIFGNNRKPQSEFHYRNLAEPVYDLSQEMYDFLSEACPEMMSQTHGEAGSLLPYFPGYKYENGISTYRGEEIGEGGKVYAEPGMYGDVALLDIASMHPHSAIAEVLFGIQYTKAFRDIVEGRVHIKHEAWDEVNHMLDGKLTPYIQRVINGEMTAKDLANALKTAINSVYGLTKAGFDNAFRDIRNKDNIVAKRGALFMTDLKFEVQKRGFTVAHIKTDSIKIPDATPEIIQFVMDFGKKYGYTFEHEATYDRMCLVNDSVYIAKYKTAEECEKMYGYVPGDCKKKGGEWTATGKQFAVPYVYKTLFSKEPISTDDMREVFSTQSALYLDMNESLPDVSSEEALLSKAESKYKKGQLSDTTFTETCDDLIPKINAGHDFRFVGKVGEFCPVIPGTGGGLLMREQNGKYYAASGTKGFRWLESEMIFKPTEETKTIIDEVTGEEKDIAKKEAIEGNANIIDRSYYNKLVDDAVEAISNYGDFEWFVSDDPYVSKSPLPEFMNIPENAPEELPFY